MRAVLSRHSPAILRAVPVEERALFLNLRHNQRIELGSVVAVEFVGTLGKHDSVGARIVCGARLHPFFEVVGRRRTCAWVWLSAMTTVSSQAAASRVPARYSAWSMVRILSAFALVPAHTAGAA